MSRYDEGESWWQRDGLDIDDAASTYIASLYWAATTITTVSSARGGGNADWLATMPIFLVLPRRSASGLPAQQVSLARGVSRRCGSAFQYLVISLYLRLAHGLLIQAGRAENHRSSIPSHANPAHSTIHKLKSCSLCSPLVSWVSSECVRVCVQVVITFCGSFFVCFPIQVGYGDIVPTSDLERMIACITMLCGTTMFSYVIGSVSTLVM